MPRRAISGRRSISRRRKRLSDRDLGLCGRDMPLRLPSSRCYWAITLNDPKVDVTARGIRLAKALCELQESQFANVLDHDVLYVEPLGVQVNTDNGIRGALNEKLYGLGVQFIAVDTNVEPGLLGYITRGTTMEVTCLPTLCPHL